MIDSSTRLTQVGAGRFRFLSLASLALLAIPSAAFATGRHYAEQIVPLAGSLRHPEAAQANLAPADDNEGVHFAISLQPRNLAGLKAFVEEVSDPHSPQFRQFLTPEQVGQQFGPTQDTITKTEAFLTSNGFTISEVAKNGFLIVADGTVAQVAKTFKTQVGYSTMIGANGLPRLYRTNLSTLQMPASLAGQVVSVDGIDTSIELIRRTNTTQLSPTTYRPAYGASTGYAAGFYGQGVRIGIANWDGYRLNNIPLWTSAYSLPVPTGGAGSNIKVVKVGTGSRTYGTGTPQGEGDLDLQAVMMAAPLASIYDYDDSTNDTAAPLTTLSKISSDNIVDIATESYGWETSSGSTYYGSTYTSAHNIHLSMSAQGITYLAATGDSGTSNFPSTGARYGYPDIDPEVLMVGGSVMTVNSSTGARVSEASWGLSGGVGGTGGFDPYDTSAHGFAFNVAPSYQTTTISSKTSAYNFRLIPDLSSSAGGQNGLGSQTGSTGWALAIYYNNGRSYPLGTAILIDGTSIASPATAGSLAALIGHYFNGVTANSGRTNVRFGRLQSYLYSVGSNATVFNDISTGASVGNLPGTSTAATPAVGWDFATGWGSLNFAGLLQAIIGSGTTP